MKRRQNHNSIVRKPSVERLQILIRTQSGNLWQDFDPPCSFAFEKKYCGWVFIGTKIKSPHGSEFVRRSLFSFLSSVNIASLLCQKPTFEVGIIFFWTPGDISVGVVEENLVYSKCPSKLLSLHKCVFNPILIDLLTSSVSG